MGLRAEGGENEGRRPGRGLGVPEFPSPDGLLERRRGVSVPGTSLGGKKRRVRSKWEEEGSRYGLRALVRRVECVERVDYGWCVCELRHNDDGVSSACVMIKGNVRRVKYCIL